MSDTLPSLKRRLSAYETELRMLERSSFGLKEVIIHMRAEIERREKEAAYAKQDD